MKYRIDISLGAGVKDIASEAILKTANGNPELGGIQLEVFSQKFPSKGTGLGLEIIAKAEVSAHFKKRVVARSSAHVLEIVVLPRNAEDFLHGCRP